MIINMFVRFCERPSVSNYHGRNVKLDKQDQYILFLLINLGFFFRPGLALAAE